MEKKTGLLDLVLNRGKKNIYRRILRTALWGSLLNFLAMGVICLGGITFFYDETINRGEELSENVGDYLEDTLKDKVKEHLVETNSLRAQLVGRMLKGCAMNVEYTAEKMTDILSHEEAHVPTVLPVANEEAVPDDVPYVYYSPALEKEGISPSLQQEIYYVSSINDELKRMSTRYAGAIVVGSEHGYLIRIDMFEDGYDGAILSHEPFRSTYDFLERDWYKETKAANKLYYTNPYMATYGKPCISVCAPYYDEQGFAGAVVADIDTEDILSRMKNANADAADFSFILGRNGQVLISGYDEGVFAALNLNNDLRKVDGDLASTAQSMVAGETGIAKIKVEQKEYYLAYAPLGDMGWSIGTAVARQDILATVKQIEGYTVALINAYLGGMTRFLLLMLLLAMVLLGGVMAVLAKANERMAQGIAAPIRLLTEGSEEIARGNLEKKLEIKTGDELETLAHSFNHMTDELQIYMKNLARTTARQERMATELDLAQRIQLGILPWGENPYPERSDFDLAALTHPAREVGGDFYDFYFLDDRHLVITVADVSDKGVPAALFMMITKTMLKEQLLFAGAAEQLSRVFQKSNDALADNNELDMFVTVFTGIIDMETGEFIYVNAGHNPPIVSHNGQSSYLLGSGNPIMGTIAGLTFQPGRLQLAPGDRLLLYTDGVTEARNSTREFFGAARLEKIFAGENSSMDAQGGIQYIYKSVNDFVGEAVQADDITLLEFIYYGAPEEERIDLP